MAAAFGLIAFGVTAQDSSSAAKEKLEQLEAEIAASERQKDILTQQSRRALAAADKVSSSLIEIARDIQVAEGNVSRLEVRITTLEANMAEKRTSLLTNNDNIVELIAAVERLSKRPAVLALLKPGDALTTARSTSLMASLIPEIDAKATKLRADLTGLAQIQTQLSDERFKLKNGLEDLTKNQQNLASLFERRRAEAGQANSRAQSLARELKTFSDEASSLRELIAKLEQQAAKQRSLAARRDTPKTIERPFSSLGKALSELKGQLPYPAIGTISQRFGARDGVGSAKGIRIRTRDNAQVISPYDGSIVFAGPFRNYGLLLIIDHGDGYHSLLAGFDTLQSAVGQWVLMGEPIGTMPSRASQTEAGELYLELRRGGTAINPLPWLQKQTASAR